MATALPKIVAGEPDAIQLNPGGLKIFNSLKLNSKVAVVLRLDATNAYEPRELDYAWDTVSQYTLRDASDKKVACVVLNLLSLDSNSRLQEQCVQNIQMIGAKCREDGIPLMVEPLVMSTQSGASPASVTDAREISALVRQAVELGADLIKVDPTNPMDDFASVVEIASGVPVLVRGGGKVTPRELLQRTRTAIDCGAYGVVYGRNIVQHSDPAQYIRAIRAVVHDKSSVDHAMQILEPETK